jgi:hypothetical protein
MMVDRTDRPRAVPVTPAGMAELAARDRETATLSLHRAETWHSLVAEQGWHVSDGRPAPGSAESWLSASGADAFTRARSEIAARGYFRWQGLVDADRCARLARSVSALCRRGWDAAFIGLVDEVWQLCFHLAAIMRRVLEPSMLFRRELFAFCVDPELAAGRSRGVPAHRDRPDSGFDRVDGLAMPRHCTCWLSLTEADEANGCMYLVPARADDDASLASPPLESKLGLPLPTRAGDLLAWNGQAVHWGGRRDAARARGSRISLAFSLTDSRIPSIGGFAPVEPDTLPGLAERLSLVAALQQWLNPPARGSAMETVLHLLRSGS